MCGVSHRAVRPTGAGVASPACQEPAMEPVNKEVDYFMSTDTAGAILRAGDTELHLPLVGSTEGSDGYDISKLLKETGQVTLDPGFVNTASCSSAITYIDGDAGILRYRGYPIEQLAENSTFLETSHLLIYGELPTAQQLENFDARIRHHTLLHEDLKSFFGGFPRDAHPMPVLSSAVSALSTFYQDSLDPFDPEQVEISTVRLMAKLPTIAAYAYKKSVGQPFLYPCLLYTSDAADDLLCVDLGGRRIIKKK